MPSPNYVGFPEKKLNEIFVEYRESRKQETHDFATFLVRQDSQFFLWIRYDLYATAFGVVKLPISDKNDIDLLGLDFYLRDWIHWRTGKHETVLRRANI